MTSMPQFIEGKVRAVCPGCGGEVSTFVPLMVSDVWMRGANWGMGAARTPIEVGNLDPVVRGGAS
jgi:hypothetical protein